MRVQHSPGDGHGSVKKEARKSIASSDGIDFKKVPKAKAYFSFMLVEEQQDVWFLQHCRKGMDSAAPGETVPWEVQNLRDQLRRFSCVLLSEAEDQWTAGVTPALSRGAWRELSVWNPLEKKENSSKIRQNYINRKRQLLFPYEWFCRQENLSQMLKMPPLVH